MYFEVERKTAFGTSLIKCMLVSVLSGNIIATHFSLKIFQNIQGGCWVLSSQEEKISLPFKHTDKQIFIFQRLQDAEVGQDYVVSVSQSIN